MGQAVPRITNDISEAFDMLILIAIKLIFSRRFPPSLAGGKEKHRSPPVLDEIKFISLKPISMFWLKPICCLAFICEWAKATFLLALTIPSHSHICICQF